MAMWLCQKFAIQNLHNMVLIVMAPDELKQVNPE